MNSRTHYLTGLVLVVAISIISFVTGCGGGGGDRVATPDMMETEPTAPPSATISSRILIASSGARVSARPADAFLSKITAGVQQSLALPASGYVPLDGATISGTVDGQLFQTDTDKNGDWAASALPEGTKEFIVSKDGKQAKFPVTVAKDKKHDQLLTITDGDAGWEPEGQIIHDDGTDGYKKETHADTTSDTVFENGVRDHHYADGYTDRDTNDDGIVDQRFLDVDDDGVPDSEISYSGGEQVESAIAPDSSAVDNQPPKVKNINVKDSKGKKTDTVMCDGSVDLDLDLEEVDGDPTTVKWTIYDAEGNDVTYLLDADNIVAPTFSPPAGECQKPGAYEIAVSVEDANGGSTGKDMILSVETDGNKSPKVHIKANHTVGDAPLTVTLDCVAHDIDGDIAAYCWDFDKSNGINQQECDDTSQTVTKTFISPGKYRTTCIVTDDQGSVNFAKRVIIVRKGQFKPQVDAFTPDKTNVSPGEPVTINIGANDPDGGPVTIEVDAPDGTFSDSDASDGTVVWVPPTEPGEYIVNVKVTDQDGEVTTETIAIRVGGTEASDPQPPSVTATATPDNGTEPLTVTLSASAQDPDGTIVSYEWDFNDEDGFQAQKTGDTVSVEYGAPGVYVATVKACDNSGMCAYDTVTVTVEEGNDPPEPQVFVDEDRGAPGGKIQLSADPGDNDSVNYRWDVSAGSLSDPYSPIPEWTLPTTPGKHTATLTVDDGVNPPVTETVEITVIDEQNEDTGDNPGGAVICDNTNRIFVINQNQNNVSILNSEQFDKIGDTQLDGTPTDICAPSDCSAIYVTNSNNLTVLDSTSGSIVSTVSMSGASSCEVNEVTNEIYIGNENTNSVTIVNQQTLTIEQEITLPGGGGCTGCANVCGCDQQSGYVFITNENTNTLSVLDGISQSQLTTIEVGDGPSGCTSGGGNKVFVSNKNENTISLISVGPGGSSTTYPPVGLPVGDEAPVCGCGVDTTDNQIFISNINTNTISIIGGDTMQPVDSIYTGDIPGCMVVDEARHKLLVCNRNDDSVSLIPNPLPDLNLDTTPPAAPPVCKATGHNGGMDLYWTASSAFDVNSYSIYRSESESGPFAFVASVDGFSSSYEDLTVSNETTYYYQISAVDTSSNQSMACAGAEGTPDSSIEIVVPAPEESCCMAGDSVNNYIYIANENNNTIEVINKDTYQVIRTIDMSQGGCCSDIVVDRINNRIFVTNKNTNKLTIINGTTHVIEEVINVPGSGGPGKCVYNDITNEISIVNENTNEVIIMNPDTYEYKTVYVPTDSGGDDDDIVVNRTTNKIFVLNSNTNKITVIDGTNYTVIETIVLPPGSSGCIINEETNSIYITNENTNELTIINTTDFTIRRTVTLPGGGGSGLGCGACYADPVSNQIFISNKNENSISIIDGADYSLIETFYTGDGPSDIVTFNDGAGAQIYIHNENSNTISIGTSPAPPAPSDIVEPSAPTGLAAIYSNGAIALTWTAVTDADVAYYNVYRSEISGEGYVLLRLAESGTSWTDTNIKLGKSYYYVVMAADTSGNLSAMSNEAYVHTTAPLDVFAGDGPFNATVNLANNFAYVSNRESFNVTVINRMTGTVVGMIPVGQQPGGIATVQQGDKVYVANTGDNTISILDIANDHAVTTIPAPGIFAAAAAASPPGDSRYFITFASSDTIVVKDQADNSTKFTIPVGELPSGMAIGPTGIVFVTNFEDNTVSVVDYAAGSVAATIPVGTGPYDATYMPGRQKVYVSNRSEGTVSVIDSNYSVVATITVGSQPAGIDSDTTRNIVYVANNASGNISIISGATDKAIGSVPVGTDPWDVAVDPVYNKLYVPIMTEDKVSIVDGYEDNQCAAAPAGATACCAPRGEMCISVVEPVCGSDGQTHSNGGCACTIESVDYYTEGACP